MNAPAIRGIAYAVPAVSRSVRELALAGALESDAGLLEGFGFARVHVACAESPYDLAHASASQLLTEQDIDPASIGLLVYGGTPSAIAGRWNWWPGTTSSSRRATRPALLAVPRPPAPRAIQPRA